MTVRVLIVDDHAPFRSAARTIVAATAGFEVAGEALDGRSSIEATRRLHPDLVLMDLRLPDIDGLTASRALRGGERPPVVILVSSHDLSDYSEVASASGVAECIAKSELGPARLVLAWRRATGAPEA